MFLSSLASTSAFWMYSDSSSAGVRPLISMLIGVCGKARITSRRVGTRKSFALNRRGGFFLPVAMPRNLYADAGRLWL